jgi:hypothetical protein
MEHMEQKGYISDICAYSQYTLDALQKRILGKLVQGSKSTYQLRRLLVEDGFKISYKNVHYKVKDLLQNGLIERAEVSKDAKENIHGAIYYKLSTVGLVYVIHNKLVFLYDDLLTSKNYKNNPLFKDLIYSIFEEKTLINPPVLLRNFIIWHLERCADTIVGISKTIPKYEKFFHGKLRKLLEISLESQNRLLVARLIMMTKRDASEFELTNVFMEPPIPLGDPRYSLKHLSKDRIFLKRASEISRNFMKGCELLSLPSGA